MNAMIDLIERTGEILYAACEVIMYGAVTAMAVLAVLAVSTCYWSGRR